MKKANYVIVSYQRSGANWLRYIIQRLLNDSIDADILCANNSSTCVKHHNIEEVSEDSKLILLLRDYKEAIPSQLMKFSQPTNRKKTSNYKDSFQVEIDGAIAEATKYAQIVNNAAPKAVKIVYYEDLMNAPQVFICDLALFIGAGMKTTNDFIMNLKSHRTIVMDQYKKAYGQYSEGQLQFYKTNLPLKCLCAMIGALYGRLERKHWEVLKRYETDCSSW